MDRKIEIQIAADARQAVTIMKDLSDKMSGLGKSMRAASAESTGMSNALAKIGPYVTAAFSLSQIKNFAFSLRDAQLDVTRLANTLAYAMGGASAGAAGMRYVTDLSNRLGLEIKATADGFAKFSASASSANLGLGQTRAVFESVSKAVAVLGLSSSDANGVFLAMSQMLSKGTVSAEELRGQMGERIPGAFDMAARAMGVTTQQLGKMLDKGQVVASDFLPKLAREMDKAFGAASGAAAQSAVANVNRLSNAWEQFKQKFGTATDAAGVTAPRWLARALNESNAAMDKSIAKGDKLLAIFGALGGFGAGGLGLGMLDQQNRQERIIELQEKRFRLEEQIQKITTGPGSADAKKGGVASLKSDIAAINRELESLWKMDKIKLPSKSELERGAADTLKSVKPTLSSTGEKLPAWKEIYDNNGTLLYKTRSEGVERFLAAQERDYKAMQASIGEQVLAVMEADEKWAQIEQEHFASTWSEIARQRQDQILGAVDLDNDVAARLRSVSEAAFGDTYSGRFEVISQQLQSDIARLEAVKSALGDFGASNLLFSINANADASYKQASVQGAQEAISSAEQSRQSRLNTLQAEVTAGIKLQTEARREGIGISKATLDAMTPHLDVLKNLASSGYPPAIKAMDEYKASLVELTDASRDKTWVDGVQAGLKDYSGAFVDTFASVRGVVTNAFKGMDEALTEFVMTGKMNFNSLANSIISDLARIAIQQSITKPMASAMSSINWGDMFGFAQGGVPGGVSAWRNQIVDRPTFFAFAQGGVMGEAGPEAIMPLRRGPGGRLGIDASGGAPGVQVIINNSVQGAQATVKESNSGGTHIIEVVLQTVNNRIAADIRRGGGPIPDALSNTYGLNRVAGAY